MATQSTADATDRCPECHTPTAERPRERVCPDCGLVIEADLIDYGPEWRGRFDPEREQQVRTKAGNRDLHDRGLGTVLSADGGDRDAARRARIHQHTRTGDKRDRNRGYATAEIQRMTVALDLGDDLATRAKRLFRAVHEERSQAGHDLDALAGAAVYGVARIHQRGVAPDAVATVARADATAISRDWRYLQREAGIEAPPPDPRQRIRVVAREADVSSQARERAVSALAELDDHEVANGSPSTLAAALLWLASEQTQAEVAEAAGVTPTGMRQRWHRLDDVPMED